MAQTKYCWRRSRSRTHDGSIVICEERHADRDGDMLEDVEATGGTGHRREEREVDLSGEVRWPQRRIRGGEKGGASDDTDEAQGDAMDFRMGYSPFG